MPDTPHISQTHSFRCPQCGERDMFSSSGTRQIDGDRVYICTAGPSCRWEGSAAECFTVLRLTPEKHLPPYLRRRVPTLSDSQIGHVDGPEAQAFTDLCDRAYRRARIGGMPWFYTFLATPGWPGTFFERFALSVAMFRD